MSAQKKIISVLLLSILGYAFYKYSSSKATPTKVSTATGNANANNLPANSGTKSNNTSPVTTPTTTNANQFVNNQQNVPASFNDIPVTTTIPTAVITLNRDLLLQLDMVGNEVEELQRLLNIYPSGLFDSGTQSELLSKKGVNKITLNQFQSRPNRLVSDNGLYQHSYAIGDTVIAAYLPNKSDLLVTYVKVYNEVSFADRTTQYLIPGQDVGTIYRKLEQGSKTDPLYLIKISVPAPSNFYAADKGYFLKVKQSQIIKK